MNTIGADTLQLNYPYKAYTHKKAPESDITQDEFLKDYLSYNDKLANNFENNMRADITGYIIDDMNCDFASGDGMAKIDTLVKKSEEYTSYINKSYEGAERDWYLSALNQNVNDEAYNIAEYMSNGFSKFLSLNEKDADSLKTDIASIIMSRTGRKSSADSSKAGMNLDYDDLKTLNTAVRGINKDLGIGNGASSLDFTAQAAYLGQALMKANFVAEKTNLPDKLKKHLSDAVLSKVQKGIKDILSTEKVSEYFRNVWAKEKNVTLNNSIYDSVKKDIANIYEGFNKVNFKGRDFRTQFMKLLQFINESYLEKIQVYKDADKKLGTNTASRLEKAQSTFNDNFSSDWNDFIDNVSIEGDKSIYYLQASNHNLIDVLA